MKKRTKKETFYTGCGYTILGTLAFLFFLGLTVAYGIRVASLVVGIIVAVFFAVLFAICLIEEGTPHEKKDDVIDLNNWNYDLKANNSKCE